MYYMVARKPSVTIHIFGCNPSLSKRYVTRLINKVWGCGSVLSVCLFLFRKMEPESKVTTLFVSHVKPHLSIPSAPFFILIFLLYFLCIINMYMLYNHIHFDRSYIFCTIMYILNFHVYFNYHIYFEQSCIF